MSTSPRTAAIQVVICDDDAIVREALTGVLAREEDITVRAAVGTAEEALELIPAAGIDVVLMDLTLPGLDGLGATRRAVAEHPGVRVLVLTTFGTDEQIREAIAAGAVGFLLKTTPSGALVAAVRGAAQRAGTLLSPEIAEQLASGASVGPGDEHALVDTETLESLHLSDREREVLSLVCAAEPNARIARALMLSESTVKSHLSSLMGKLGCASRLQLALRAFELGLVPAPRPGRRG